MRNRFVIYIFFVFCVFLYFDPLDLTRIAKRHAYKKKIALKFSAINHFGNSIEKKIHQKQQGMNVKCIFGLEDDTIVQPLTVLQLCIFKMNLNKLISFKTMMFLATLRCV